MSTEQSERRLGTRARPTERGIPLAEPTRRTLVFPAVEVPRSRRIATPPPLPPLPALPPSRPSERPTLKTLPPIDEAKPGTSNTQVIELSASALDSDPSLLDLGLRVDLDASRVGEFERLGGWRARARGARRWLGYAALAACGAGVYLAACAEPFGTASLVERVTGVSDGLRGGPRALRQAASDHTPLVLRAAAMEPTAPARACATSGAARVLAKRAHLGPGLDVSVFDGGFGIGFATGRDEALGVRVDGAPMRVAERVRVRASSGVKHVAVDAGRSDDDALELRVDADDARSVVPDGGETPAFRVAAVGGWIQVTGGGLATGRTLWPVPGGAGAGAGAGASAGARAGASASASAGASASASAGGAKAKAAEVKAKGDAIVGVMMAARSQAAAQGATRARDGFVRLGAGTPAGVAPAMTVDVRAAARDDGGAVIALRRPSALWLGLVDGRFAAEAPLLALTRPGAVIGMPSVAPWGRGGAVAWAERPAGDHEWLVMVASFAGHGDSDGASAHASTSAHEAPTLRVIAAGMSPSIATLPDGDLLLAYAVGVSGSHRVVVRRLGHDLEPRGEPVLVSPDELNAGQPAAAVAPDGRALVAFFGAERGRPSSVLATPLACATGM
ncbi:MAG: Basic proline-rich protein [Myxococcaceae bacterium]|nr:Basic proline-rich protein [Myxococcaceae bacterium]